MSRTSVGIVVHKLLTDEDLRIRFALDPMETVAELCLRGFDLTRDEIDLSVPDRCWCVVPEKRRQRRSTALRIAGVISRTRYTVVPIYIGLFTPQETLVLNTRASVYELTSLGCASPE